MAGRPQQLKCEYLVDPIGIGARRPRLSWILPPTPDTRGERQSAYQILVASGAEVWDSGRVASGRCANVRHEGPPLSSGQRCTWKVRCWGEDRTAGPYSEPASFEAGLLEPGDWRAHWIAADVGVSAPLLRRSFTLGAQPERARVYVCGLGYHELYVNGSKVDDQLLAPASSYYHHDLPFELQPRILYVTYDISQRVRIGENAIGVVLGHGWYSAEADRPPAPSHGTPYGDRPVLLLQARIDLANGERIALLSDEEWRWARGPILYNDYCDGETYDARQAQPGWTAPGYDSAAWHPVLRVAGPNGTLAAQPLEPTRVVETMRPIAISHAEDHSIVFDFGQNFSGWTRIRVRGPAGTRVSLRHATEITERGRLGRPPAGWLGPLSLPDWVAGDRPVSGGTR